MPEKYIATTDDEEVLFYSDGETPDLAFAEFVTSGELEAYCGYAGVPEGDHVYVYIYSWLEPENSDWPDEEIDPKWQFVLDKKIETKTVLAPAA